MGCDIHPTVQYVLYPADGKSGRGDYWTSLSYRPMSWGRDYGLFTLLAGVRCGCSDHPGVWRCPKVKHAPRGLPPEGPAHGFDDADLHTPSWLTLDELKDVIAGYDCGADVYATIAAMEEF